MKIEPMANNVVSIETEKGLKFQLRDDSNGVTISGYHEGTALKFFRMEGVEPPEFLFEDFDIKIEKGRDKKDCYDKEGNSLLK